MVLEVANNPNATVNEQQNARLLCFLLWRHDVQLYGSSVLCDCLFGYVHPGHVDGCLVLETSQDLLRLRLWQFPKGAAVFVKIREKGPHLWVDSTIGRRVRRLSFECLRHNDSS